MIVSIFIDSSKKWFQLYLIIKMKCKTCLGEFIKFFDLFSLTQFLRYKQDEDYKTVSGGLTSLFVVCIFIILFSSNAVSTVNKTSISWEAITSYAFKPTPTIVQFDNSNFMFAIGVVGLNLSSTTIRYFDISMVETHIVNDTFHQSTPIPL